MSTSDEEQEHGIYFRKGGFGWDPRELGWIGGRAC
jgi:hypothetical protein